MLRNSSSVLLFVKFLKYDIEIDIYIDIDIASKISVRKIDLIGIIDKEERYDFVAFRSEACSINLSVRRKRK